MVSELFVDTSGWFPLVDHETRAQRDWLERYDDQDFSFTDAVSFTVMTERGIRDALAVDRHFAVAGFVVVPAEAC